MAPHFKSPEELQKKIDAYFNYGVRSKTVLIGKDKIPTEIPIPTISGLAYYLGFASRQSFYDYEKMENYSYTIKRARLFIETEYEMQLSVGNTTGAIFALKNMGWIDQISTDLTTLGKEIKQAPSIVFKTFKKDE
jgi:hypothetical protein